MPRINMRLKDHEHEEILKRAGGIPPATYCKAQLLDPENLKRRRPVRTKYKNIDFAVLRELSRVGNNLNQIARLAHIAKRKNDLELIQLISCLDEIQKELSQIRLNLISE